MAAMKGAFAFFASFAFFALFAAVPPVPRRAVRDAIEIAVRDDRDLQKNQYIPEYACPPDMYRIAAAYPQ